MARIALLKYLEFIQCRTCSQCFHISYHSPKVTFAKHMLKETFVMSRSEQLKRSTVVFVKEM